MDGMNPNSVGTPAPGRADKNIVAGPRSGIFGSRAARLIWRNEPNFRGIPDRSQRNGLNPCKSCGRNEANCAIAFLRERTQFRSCLRPQLLANTSYSSRAGTARARVFLSTSRTRRGTNPISRRTPCKLKNFIGQFSVPCGSPDFRNRAPQWME